MAQSTFTRPTSSTSLQAAESGYRGPHVAPSAVEANALLSSGCPVPAQLTGSRDELSGKGGCTSVSVKLLVSPIRASEQLAGLVQPGWITTTSAIYFVTVHGTLHFSPMCPCPVPITVSHLNFVYDAKSGQGLGGGTAGTPLP